MTDDTPAVKPHGFAALTPEQRRELGRKGGRRAQATGTANTFDSDSAAEAGRKGGAVVSADRAHMSDIGRKGGAASSKIRRRAEADE